MYIHLIFIYRHIQTFDSLDHFVLENKIFKTPNLFTNCPPLTCNMSRLLSMLVDGFWIFLKIFIKCLWSLSSITSQLLFTCLHEYESIDRNFLFYRNRSWPAVSQIWSLTDFPPTFTTLLPNSTPIVWLESFLTENSKKNLKIIDVYYFFLNLIHLLIWRKTEKKLQSIY